MEVLIFAFIALIVFGVFCGYIAEQKRRSFANWFWLGFFFSFIALIAIAVLPSINIKKSSDGLRKCPSCAELVKEEAVVCRFCQRELPIKPTIVTEELQPTAKTHVICPKCEKIVRREALKCNHCGCELTPIKYKPRK